MSHCPHIPVAVLTLVMGMAQLAQAQLQLPPDSHMLDGTTAMSCLSVEIGGTYSGTLREAGPVRIDASGRMQAQGDMQFGASLDNQGQLNADAATLTLDGSCAPAGSAIAVAGTLEVPNLTIGSTTGQTFVLQPGTQITVTQQLTLQGTPNAPLTLSTADGQPITIALGPQAQVTRTDTVTQNVLIGAQPPDPPAPTIEPVPTLGAAWTGLLALLMPLALLALRRRTTLSLPRLP